MTDKLEFKGLEDVLAHFEKSGKASLEAVKTYRSQIKELTGHDPSAPITPLDVVKIVQKVFFGGAAHDSTRVDPSRPGPGPGGVEPPQRVLPPPPGGERPDPKGGTTAARKPRLKAIPRSGADSGKA